MKKIFFAALMMIICLPAFAKKAKKKTKHPKATTGIQSILMFKTNCYGHCPVYNIKVENNGMVTYDGQANVADSGIYTKNVGATKAMDIINKLTSHKVDTCHNFYESKTPDLPGINYMVQYKDSTKRISNANWGPQFLREVAGDIDELGKVHDSSWKKAKKGK